MAPHTVDRAGFDERGGDSMASGADDSGVPGSGDSDQAVEANGASRWADWTLNRVLVVAGVVFAVLPPPLFCATNAFFVGPPPLPLLPRRVLSRRPPSRA